MSRLERSYRRLLRLYPRHYRAGRKEEMLGVLLDTARPGQQRPSAADAADLALGALRVRGAGAARAARARPAAATGWAVLTAGTVVALLPTVPPVPRTPDALPSAFAGYSYLTGEASSSPPGPAVALYQQGFGVESLDFPQAVVVGANGTYRRLDQAERRSSAADQGDPESMLLSPDGAHVAVGEDPRGSPEVAVQDLGTGTVRTWPVGRGEGAAPVAWSPDGRRLAVLVHLTPPELRYHPSSDVMLLPGEERHPGYDLLGRLVLLDPVTGEVQPLTSAPPRPVTAAFAPDGERLAVEDASGELVLVDADGGPPHSLGFPGLSLAGPGAWSPDGRLLASDGPLPFVANSRQCDGFIAVDGGPAPACVDAGPDGHHSFVGWTGPRSAAVLVGVTPDGEEADPARLVEVDLADGTRTPLSAIPTGGANYQVGGLQVARTALLTGVVQEPPPTDRGRWSPLLRLVAASAFAGCAAAAASAAARRFARHRRRRALRAGPPSPADGT